MIRKTHMSVAAVGMVLVASTAANMFLAPSNIDPAHKFSWSENTGWMNWRDADSATAGVLVGDDFLSGNMWAENLGWINTGDGSGPYANTADTDFGVNILVGGDLDGLAWSENVGWLNFGWAASTTNLNRARFDSGANRFRGWVWGENIGWLNLDDATHYVAAMLGQLDPPSASPDPSTVRFISFVVPASSAGTDTAYRVQLTDLYGQGVCCANGNPNSCNTTACANNGQCGGAFPTCTQRLLPFEGQFRYLNSFGGSTTCVDSATLNTNYRCATLGCQPEYRDWGSEVGGMTLHVTGDSVAPKGTYAVAQIAESCGAAPAADTCASASLALLVGTVNWGDAGGAGSGPPDGVANVIDIGLVVDNVKELASALPERRCWMKQQNPVPHTDPINVIDIGLTVDAVKGFPYPYSINACP